MRQRYVGVSEWPVFVAIFLAVVIGTVLFDVENRPMLEGIALMIAVTAPAGWIVLEISLQLSRRRARRDQS